MKNTMNKNNTYTKKEHRKAVQRHVESIGLTGGRFANMKKPQRGQVQRQRMKANESK